MSPSTAPTSAVIPSDALPNGPSMNSWCDLVFPVAAHFPDTGESVPVNVIRLVPSSPTSVTR
ncbi:hypothetical protein SAMN05444580_10144 [Rhodococcus tukisamuensis]|uniref:Uncharacterized protein n=1 Tax=Rhodococcus tukisamuensis TaxID=168276 RepID=A0A1G6M2S9_9NOCA|nr:hypothetical protein SAMN05444580_10144 [Rhodococcus tukisamuensis]